MEDYARNCRPGKLLKFSTWMANRILKIVTTLHPGSRSPRSVVKLLLKKETWTFCVGDLSRLGQKIGNKMINARAETIFEKPSYRDAFKKRRCLIPTNGYYEWKKSPSGNQPYFIKMKDEEIFAMAGLWETWKNPSGEVLETCTIITTEANEIMSDIHHRMPVIISNNNYKSWLSGDTLSDNWLCPFDSDLLIAYKIGTYVNSPANEGSECIRPAS